MKAKQNHPWQTPYGKRIRNGFIKKHPLCAHCLEQGIDVMADEVDHIIRWTRGGSWYGEHNLQSLCKECHDIKTAEEDEDYEDFFPDPKEGS